MAMIALFYSGTYIPCKSGMDMIRDTFFSAKTHIVLIYKLILIELGNIYFFIHNW